MKNYFFFGVLALLTIVNSSFVFPQDDALTVGYLTVQSTQRDIRVYDDTLFLGTTPLSDVPLRTGYHILRYVRSEKNDWSAAVAADTLFVMAGERIEKKISLPANYHIISEPFGAEVVIDDSVVGITPCFISLLNPPRAVLLRKPGFSSEEVLFTENTRRMYVVLSPQSGESETISYLVRESTDADVPMYLTATATIISGVSAVYFKVKADNVYAEYRLTGNEALVRQVKHYDTISGISLAVSEISLGFLTYLLLSR